MLKRLRIKNYALIADADISFEDGLTVITGETGAGKSILLGALSLILGARADRTHFKDKNLKCTVEGVFDLKAYSLKDFFIATDLDYFDETIIRREITPQGKSRIFINDTPTTLDLSKSIGEKLIDIHSQHQSLLLNQEEFQLNCLDALANNKSLLDQYQLKFQEATACRTNIKALELQQQKAQADEDYLQFQIKELEALNYQQGELPELEQELNRLSNAEDLIQSFSGANQVLDEDEFSILNNLRVLKTTLKKIVHLDSSLNQLLQRIESSEIDLADIRDELQQNADKVNIDPNRLLFVEDRINEIHRLQQKHRLQYADDLLLLLDSLNKEIISSNSLDQKIEDEKLSLKKLETELYDEAKQLSERRRGVVPEFVVSVENNLKQLGMSNAKLSIQLNDTDLSLNGKDDIHFYFSANKGIEPQRISKVASGGELSRLMLSIKAIQAEHQSLGTLLFDEIDTGISGEVAAKMGAILLEMGQKRQLICISHIPQVAAKAQNHLLVYKNEKENITQTNIKVLSREERIIELAKMLSGKEMTEAAMNNAEELFNSN